MTRLERLNKAQWEGVETWIGPPYMANGTLEWYPGCGKTHGFYKGYQRFRSKFNNESDNIYVVVPTQKLKDDWEAPETGHIAKWNLQNIEVFVINTYITKLRVCRWLVVDEVHHILSEDAKTFNTVLDITQCQFKLGLSGTLTNIEKNILVRRGMPVVHTIDEERAKEEGFISEDIEFNLAVKFNEVEAADYKKYSEMHDKNMRFFVIDNQFDFKLASTCTRSIEACKRVAIYRGWNYGLGEKHDDSPQNIKKYANMWSMGMTRRKEVLNNCRNKVEVAINLIQKFEKSKIITFSELSDVADTISKFLPNISRSYHTKVKATDAGEDLFGNPTKKLGVKKTKEKALEDFIEGRIRCLNTVRALDEGMDIPTIDMSIVLSGSSKSRQHRQRKARAGRYVEGKKALIVNLYVAGTQEEKWLKKRQEDSVFKPIWITDFNEVSYEPPVESEDFYFDASGID